MFHIRLEAVDLACPCLARFNADDEDHGMSGYTVEVAFDGEARVWYVERSDIPGLNVEAPTYEDLVEIVLDAAPELIEHNLEGDASRTSFSVDVVQHATAIRARA